MQKLEIGNGKLELKNWEEKIGIGIHLVISLCR